MLAAQAKVSITLAALAKVSFFTTQTGERLFSSCVSNGLLRKLFFSLSLILAASQLEFIASGHLLTKHALME